MSVRDADWYLERDRSGLVRGIEAELDDLARRTTEALRHSHADTLERLRRLGLDDLADSYAEPTPWLDERETFASRWPTEADYERHELATRRAPEAEPEHDPSRLGAGLMARRATGRVTGVR